MAADKVKTQPLLNYVVMNFNFTTLSRFREYAPFLLRLAFGIQLIYYTQDNVFHYERMQEFAKYLDKLNFPIPLVMASVSVYAEFIGGILMILGWQTRWVGAVLTVNFVIAFVFAHAAINDTYLNSYPALHLLAMSVFLLLNGPGKPSVDEGI